MNSINSTNSINYMFPGFLMKSSMKSIRIGFYVLKVFIEFKCFKWFMYDKWNLTFLRHKLIRCFWSSPLKFYKIKLLSFNNKIYFTKKLYNYVENFFFIDMIYGKLCKTQNDILILAKFLNTLQATKTIKYIFLVRNMNSKISA